MMFSVWYIEEICYVVDCQYEIVIVEFLLWQDFCVVCILYGCDCCCVGCVVDLLQCVLYEMEVVMFCLCCVFDCVGGWIVMV